MKNNDLPPNCPMKKADYDHYCPSTYFGPESYRQTGMCSKHDECVKIVKDFKKMGIPTTSETLKTHNL